jgi:D-glycero-alpha-D-manno-heptose-7-phosphate kinase
MANENWYDLLAQKPMMTSAPCRIDMGGTLDLSTFYLPLRHLNPCTFNLAIALRTKVRLSAFKRGWVKVSSRGFKDAEFVMDEVPFRHPMGLIFAIAAYFRAEGVQIEIDSASPVRSALGGSSVAAVALITAFARLRERMGIKRLSRRDTALLAHSLEQSVAGVPCGIQDMLAAAFGGANAWQWTGQPGKAPYTKKKVISKKAHKQLERCLLLAYCGEPHESIDINGQWVHQFLTGKFRSHWMEIIRATHAFVGYLKAGDYLRAGGAMNHETDLRCEMTPAVLDDIGRKLTQAAREKNCGARFTGAGGGGCIWALGRPADIKNLKPAWQSILAEKPRAVLLDTTIDSDGVL